MKHARNDYNRIQDPAGLIPKDEPVFLLRGQDTLAPQLLKSWAHRLLGKNGDPEMAELVFQHALAMEDWQMNVKVKVPDLPPRECDDFDIWEINSGNSDALCHNEETGQSFPDLRNTEICKKCPYNEQRIGDVI